MESSLCSSTGNVSPACRTSHLLDNQIDQLLLISSDLIQKNISKPSIGNSDYERRLVRLQNPIRNLPQMNEIVEDSNIVGAVDLADSSYASKYPKEAQLNRLSIQGRNPSRLRILGEHELMDSENPKLSLPTRIINRKFP